MAEETKTEPNLIHELVADHVGKKKIYGIFGDDTPSQLTFPGMAQQQPLAKSEKSLTPLEKHLQEVLDGHSEVARLAFQVNPDYTQYQVIYQAKPRGIPEWLLKRISHQDDLVATIVRTRANQVRAFGVPRPDRFDTGFVIEAKEGVLNKLDNQQKAALDKRIEKARDLLLTCGSQEGVAIKDRQSFSDFLDLITQSAVVVGRIAVEKIRDRAGRVHSFRSVDAGTIMPATPYQTAGDSVRKQALALLARLRGEAEGELAAKLNQDSWSADKYSWVQVLEGSKVKQVFTDDQLLVTNFYPVPDVEMCGHPITPLDNVISAVTTHVNITQYNKVYFQSGRAARGALIFKSEDADYEALKAMQAHFQANINSAANAWRMPVIVIGKEDEIDWQQMDQQGQRDAEFQYLTDSVARTIMSAFQISPDELTAWSYLGRSTGSQTLSECLDPEMRVFTDVGLVPLSFVIGDKQQQRFKVWTGKTWADARVFRTGQKRLKETELACGVTIRTSPDHRFRAVNEAGDLVWKHQEELRPGDYILVNRNPIPGMLLAPSYKGKEVTPEIMEILGWMIGDGTLVSARGQMVLFYHYEKEVVEWEKHAQVLRDFGLNIHQNRIDITDEEREEIKTRYGFKNVAAYRLTNVIYDTKFVNWLETIGFKSSKEGKVIPDSLHVMPIWCREAFLRGFFSADGGKLNDQGAVAITIQNDKVRDQTRQLLMSLGIRTQYCKEVPSWVNDYHMEPVAEIRDLGRFIEMVDVEVFDSDHSFISEGFQVHNSNNEYRLEAHRDLGIRPLIRRMEDIVNNDLFPIIDPDLSKICRIRFKGLDTLSRQEEADQLGKEAPLHGTMNGILESVEKPPLPKSLGGNVPLNPAYHQLVLDKFVYVGVVCEQLLGMEGASQEPSLAYINNTIWVQWQQLMEQKRMNDMQSKAMELQEKAATKSGSPEGSPATKPGMDDAAQKSEALHGALGDAASALAKHELDELEKAERHLSPGQRRALESHKKLVKDFRNGFDEDAKRATIDIVNSVDDLLKE